jgi:phage shock protein A
VFTLAAWKDRTMASPFVKGWKYMMALFGAKIDEHADPKIQIQQAIEEAQRQHQALVGQAAAVIGNQRQLEMKLSRTMSEVEKLQSSARQALVLADKARDAGDEKKAGEYEQSAQAFAAQLVSAEQSMEDMKSMHDQAISAAEQARQAVEQNQMILQQKLAERSKLLSQLEQAKMQETIASSLESMSSLAAPGNVPNLDEVRDKIERRYATAMGRADLAGNSVEGRMLEVQKSTLELAGSSRLEQIRASLSGEKLGGDTSGAVSDKPASSADTASVSRLDEIRASLGKDKDAATG